MMGTERFRTLYIAKLAPAVAFAPFVGLFLATSSISDAWTATTWGIAGALATIAAAAYTLRLRATSYIEVDDDGIVVPVGGSRQRWQYGQMLKAKQIGRFRVRFCLQGDDPAMHSHVSVDLFDPDLFIDEVAESYEEATGRPFPDAEAPLAA